MRLIRLTEYNTETMQLAKPIMDMKGRILLAAGNSINPKYLQKIEELGVKYLIIEDAESKEITLDEMVDMPTWMDAIQEINVVYEQARLNKSFSLPNLQKVTGKLVDEVRKRPAILLIPSTLQTSELRPYAHCVNVTLIALQIAKYMKFTDLEARDLALGCLLHDIGKVIEQNNILMHPISGFEYLRKIRELSLLSAHVALQHHETIDGKGFPRQLKGAEFLPIAQICAVANVYENAISLEGIPPHEALEMVMTMYGIKYSEPVIDALIKGVPAYPPGSKIVLNTNEEAIVTKIDTHMQRPTVRILSTGEEKSLVNEPTIMIRGLVEYQSNIML